MLDKKPESIEALIEGITPEIHRSLKTAVELGKWENGQPLSREQLELCLQAVIAYEHKKVPVDLRTGFISPAGSACGSRTETIATDSRQKPGTGTDDT